MAENGNGKSNGVITINIARWQAVIGFVLGIAAVFAMIQGAVKSATKWAVQEQVKTEVSNAATALAREEAVSNRFSLQEARIVALERERGEMRDQIQFLYEREIARGGPPRRGNRVGG